MDGAGSSIWAGTRGLRKGYEQGAAWVRQCRIGWRIEGGRWVGGGGWMDWMVDIGWWEDGWQEGREYLDRWMDDG